MARTRRPANNGPKTGMGASITPPSEDHTRFSAPPAAELLHRVHNDFARSQKLAEQSIESLAPLIVAAAARIVGSLVSGHKVLLCGNGGAANCAQLFSSHLLNRYTHERPGLPAIALTTDSAVLTAIANDFHFENVFARQVLALGQPGDALVAISTTGNSSNIIRAVEAARSRDMHCIALNGRNGGELADILAEDDVNICVADESTARIREMHILIIHCLSDLIDYQLLG
ncbi:MAG: SIS domain-containing protein [Acidiferrobacterales bacterium]